jgi:hypothetical protein
MTVNLYEDVMMAYYEYTSLSPYPMSVRPSMAARDDLLNYGFLYMLDTLCLDFGWIFSVPRVGPALSGIIY